MQDYFSKVLESVTYINEKINEMPEIAIILGSGLGKLADEVTDRVEIPYSEIPNFPISKVEGHENKLIIGKIYNKQVIVMQGRFHYYEGYEMDEVTFPIKVFALLGVSKLIVSNAAGGLNPSFKVGDLVLITDHINICGLSPLRGENYSEFGVRFPGMKDAYSPRLIALAKEQYKKMEEERASANKVSFKDKLLGSNKKSVDKAENDLLIDESIAKEYADIIVDESDISINLKEGVYAFMPGPQYETRAEIKMLTTLGADCVGMSTVPEVISAAHSGIEVLGISCITDECNLDISPNHEDVIKAADRVSENFKAFVVKIISAM